MTSTETHDVASAVLAAAEQARWPDGSRILDVSDQVLVDVFVPLLAKSLPIAVDAVVVPTCAPSVSGCSSRAGCGER